MSFAEVKAAFDAFGWYGVVVLLGLAALPRIYTLVDTQLLPAWLAHVERRTVAAERAAQAMVDIAELCRATREDAAETRQSIAGIAERVAVLVDRAGRPAAPPARPARQPLRPAPEGGH